MSNINEIRDAALVSCEGIRDALGLIHAARVRDAAIMIIFLFVFVSELTQ